jgi:transcription initiation factor TFIID subunit TAF12
MREQQQQQQQQQQQRLQPHVRFSGLMPRHDATIPWKMCMAGSFTP